MIIEKHSINFTEEEKFLLDLFISKISGRSWLRFHLTEDTLAIYCYESVPGRKKTAFEIFKKTEDTWEIVYHSGNYVIYHMVWNVYNHCGLPQMLKYVLEQKDIQG